MNTNTHTNSQGGAASFDLCRISHSKEAVSLCSNTIRAYFKLGLNCYRRGKVVFFSKTELDAFIRAGNVSQKNSIARGGA
jgi:hypothetical protein